MIPFISKAEIIPKSAMIESVTPITPVKPASNSLHSPQNFIQGQKFLATVDAQLSNGNSKVLIAGQTLQMRLPDNIRPGDKIELVLISREPQLKFSLQNQAPPNALLNSPKNLSSNNTSERFFGLLAQGSVKTSTSQPLNNTTLTPTNSTLNTANNPSSISATGRFLGLLTQDSAKSTTAQPLTSTTPVLTSPPTNNAETPVLLQKALSQSGLFYESHQSQWITGEKTLAQLQQEPQGKLNVTNMNTNINTTTTATLLNAEAPVHTQSLTLVQHQLTTLESGQIIWRGEIWPEQLMDWDITEHTPDENEQNAEEPPPQWQTQIRLTLPKLGEITATLMFNAEDVSIRLRAPATETVELLKSNQPPLATAMVSAGLNIKALEIHADPKE